MNTEYYADALRHLDKEEHVFRQLLDLVTVPDGRVDTIVVKNVILTKGLRTEKLYVLGTDGAAVMTGNYFMPM